MNVAIIGCGLIGQKRAKSLGKASLVACADIVPERAHALANLFTDCKAYTDWKEMIKRDDIDIVIVATLHADLAEMGLASIQSGKHVLLEKPAGKEAKEILPLIEASEKNAKFIRVGFNHRYHPAFRKARSLVDQDALGELMFIRARYGHGGRLGYDQEWRANPVLSGGGELIDQGIHLIDLARWFLGDFTHIQGHASTYYWDMPVDDNSFLMLKTKKNQMAFLHASCTEWKNLFSFEIYGKKGKIDISGLGGSYGVERIAFYEMRPEMGPPDTFMWEYPMPDDSFEIEFNEFLEDIKNSRKPKASIHDAHAALSIVEEIYRISNL